MERGASEPLPEGQEGGLARENVPSPPAANPPHAVSPFSAMSSSPSFRRASGTSLAPVPENKVPQASAPQAGSSSVPQLPLPPRVVSLSLDPVDEEEGRAPAAAQSQPQQPLQPDSFVLSVAPDSSPPPSKGPPVLRTTSINVASLYRRRDKGLAAATRPEFKATYRDKAETGRILHAEHYHGHWQYQQDRADRAGSGPAPALEPSINPTFEEEPLDESSIRLTAKGDLEPQATLGAPLDARTSHMPLGRTSAMPLGRTSKMPLGRTSHVLMEPGEDYVMQTDTGMEAPMAPPVAQPMPKWPANWTSAAFESVAAKQSYILSPPEVYAEIAHHGQEKSKFAWYKMLLLSIVAGCYVGFGYTTALQVGGTMNQAPSNPDKSQVNIGVQKALLGAMGFPFAFTIIVVCGSELYTSMCAYTAAAWWEGKITIPTALRMLTMSYFGNFAGTAIMVGFIYGADIFDHGKSKYLIYSAEAKVSAGWGTTLIRGILANWLVGIATWMANAAQDLTGKFFGIWLPISAFAAIGFEHSIANMFVLPLAIAYGANITATQFVWRNLIPATLGNWLGGAIAVATSYAFVYGRTPPRIHAWAENTWQQMRAKTQQPSRESSEDAEFASKTRMLNNDKDQ